MQINELQKTILGLLLLFHDKLDDVEAVLEPSDFTGPMRDIYSHMLQTRSFDLTSVIAKYSHISKELIDWIDLGGEVWMLDQYCRILKENNAISKIKQVGREIQNHNMSADDLISLVENTISGLQTKSSNDPVDMKSSISRLTREIDNQVKNSGKITGLSTGFSDLDSALDGLHSGDLIIVGGRPSMGKTALAVNIGQHVANAYTVLMFSLEMSVGQVQRRILSGESNIPFNKIRSANLTDADWSLMTFAAGTMTEMKFLLDDAPGIGLQQLTSKARRMNRKHDLKLIIVDYLQLMTLPRNESRVSALGHVTRSLKNLAKELDVCVLLLSQLSRAVDAREDKRPVMSDLRESGEIEQDADVILFPFREAAYCRECRDRIDTPQHNYLKHQQKAEIIIEKQRQGERNISIPLTWCGEFVRFE